MLSNLATMEFNFQYPLAFLLPFLALLLFLVSSRNSPTLRRPSIRLVAKIEASWRLRLRKPVLYGLLGTFIVAGALGAARPQLQITGRQSENAGNIMLVVDLSKSMLTEDIVTPLKSVSRIEGIKTVMSEFIQSRPGDRIGLMVFGNDAFLKVPLTMDHELLTDVLQNLAIGIAGEKTAIGNAIAYALKRVKDLPAKSRAIVLITDGMNTAGNIDPLKAASLAHDIGIKIHTIGIGTSSFRGKVFLEGNDRSEEFDELTLKGIAEASGGVYFNAQSIGDLRRIYEELNRMDKIPSTSPKKVIITELFVYFAWISLLSFFSFVILSKSYFRKLP